MKEKIMGFARKYWLLLLADVSLIIGLLVLGLIFKDKDIIGGENIGFSAADLYILFIFPLYSVVRGILSRIYIKKVWIPSFILFIIVWLGIPIISLDFRFYLLFSIPWLFWPVFLSIVSTFFSLLTGGILRLKNFVNKKKTVGSIGGQSVVE